jgi:two-component system OmpR family sensor kinase
MSSRLVATSVLLVAVVGLLVSGATAFAMSHYLTGQKDKQLIQSLQREEGSPDGDNGPGRFCPLGHDADDRLQGRGLPPGQSSGTMTVRVGVGPNGRCAYYISADANITAIGAGTAAAIEKVPTDGQVHNIELKGHDEYRVLAATDGSVYLGLPTRDVTSAVRSLVLSELLLTLAGVALAALLGDLLVRRQLRPLREVAATAHEVTEQNLTTGDTNISTRVDERLTDPETEVGQVGGALNTLLEHVGSALAARHRSEQQVRQFVADASHELRTPLATIHGYAELSRRTPDDAEALSGAMTKVGTEATRMSTLVEDMLLLARLDSGRPLASDDVDVTKLLLEAVADARVVSPDHRWRLDLPDEPVQVSGDEQRLHQVVTNLLSNARAHTPGGTTVTVRARDLGGKAVIRVHDDGPGLSPGLAGNAFERFTRGDSSRTRASGGAGLGLSLVAAIVAAHGGTAEVTSSPGDTTFTITLPR